jgi:hypothetical protein
MRDRSRIGAEAPLRSLWIQVPSCRPTCTVARHRPLPRTRTRRSKRGVAEPHQSLIRGAIAGLIGRRSKGSLRVSEPLTRPGVRTVRRRAR